MRSMRQAACRISSSVSSGPRRSDRGVETEFEHLQGAAQVVRRRGQLVLNFISQLFDVP